MTASADWLPGSGTRYYEIPDAAAIDPGDTFTFAAVVQLGNFNADRCIADKGTNAFRIGITTAKQLTLFKSGGSQSAISNPLAIETGVPFHVIVTKSGATHAMYLNGVAVTVTVTNQTLATNALPLRIGRAQAAPVDQFNHQLAHVMLWTSALTATQCGELGRAMNPASYAYGAAEHPVVQLRQVDSARRANWTRAQGADRYADAHDFDDLYRSGPARTWLRQLDGTTDQKVRDYSADALRRETWHSELSELSCAWQAGQQVFDVVSVSYPNLAATTRLHRVLALALDYSRGPNGPGRYDATLTLGAL